MLVTINRNTYIVPKEPIDNLYRAVGPGGKKLRAGTKKLLWLKIAQHATRT